MTIFGFKGRGNFKTEQSIYRQVFLSVIFSCITGKRSNPKKMRCF